MATTRWTPSTAEMSVIVSSGRNRAGPSAPTNMMPSRTHAVTMARLMKWRPGSSTGLPPKVPCSLPNATTDPVKVMAPTKMPMIVSISWMRASTPVRWAPPTPAPKVPANPTSTAARPTKLCRMATSCGIDVISTRAASTAPITAPMASVLPSTPYAVTPGPNTVAPTAMSMPMMPSTLPRRAVFCADRPARLRMKSTPAMR